MPSHQKYTDEYLKNVLLDKFKELGRTPSRQEVLHGNTIAKRFGNGSYDEAVVNFGLTPNYSKYNKVKTKSKIEGASCIEVYEMVLQDEIKQFPKHFWEEISEIELRQLLRYFFEKKLGWTLEDIKKSLDSYIFAEYKLGGGMFQRIFNGSPFKVVDFTYPNDIKEWELKCTPLNYWTIDKCIEVTKYILEKEKWTEDNIKNKPIYSLLNQYGVTTIYSTFFNGNPYKLINSIYPNKFKPWELPYTPKNYWNVDTGKQAIKWMIEEQLRWSEKDIREKYCLKIFKQYKLEAMLNIVFKSSPYAAISATYPGKFREEDFNNVPINYWTMERAIASIKAILDKLEEEDIKKYVSVNFFIKNGLQYPFQTFFGGSPFLVLDTIYPKKFSSEDFNIKNK